MSLKILLLYLLLAWASAKENETNITQFTFLFLRQPYAIENETSVLIKMAEDNLRAEGKIPDWLEFNIIDKASCKGYGEKFSFDPVRDTAAIYYSTKVDAIVGPECSVGMLNLGQMARLWNIPIMGYRSLDDKLTDRIKYPTLSRVSVSFSSMGVALVDLLNHFNWKQVGIVKNPTSTGAMRMYRGIIRALNAAKIKVNIDIEVETKKLKSEASELFKKLRENARIIIVATEFHADPFFMETVVEHNMNQSGYFYLVPSAPPRGTKGFTNIPVMSEAAKKGYGQSLVFTAHGEDPETQKFIIGKMKKEKNVFFSDEFPSSGKDRRNQYGIIYDTFHLAMTVAGELAAQNKLHSLFDGRKFWKNIPYRQFYGVSGHIWMDKAADRVPNYLVETIFENKQKLVFFMDVIGECQGICVQSGNQMVVKSGKMIYKWIPDLRWREMKDHITIPPDEPPCGFTGAKCDKTFLFLSIAAVILGIVLSVGSYIMYKKHKEKELLRMPWRVAPDAMVAAKTNLSLGSIQSLGSAKSGSKYGGDDVVLVRHDMCRPVKYKQHGTIDFTRDQLFTLNQMKGIQHDNLSPFIGICFNNDRTNFITILWKIGSRGTLEDILFNTDIQLDKVFQASFTWDTIRGMEYLHNSLVKVHGALDASNCLITSHWLVKMSNFGLQELLCDLSSKKEITYEKENWTRLAHVAPELLLENTEEPIQATQQGDIYSLGILIYQILYRSEPFDSGDVDSSVEEMINNWIQNNEQQQKPKPILPKERVIDSEGIQILKNCWNDDPSSRPTLKEIRAVAKFISSDKGSLVDNMVKMMEAYAENLEKLVRDRTILLEDAQKRADTLLFRLLPVSVATDLKAGKPVEPKIFTSVTVFFSDIVGFTTICAESTPIQIVNFLNGLFSKYDAIIETRDAYKVETIGDAYMVVSGLPKLNGDSHSFCIANITLLMRQATGKFKLIHKPETQLKIRIGIASGPVAAGVIGIGAPRYCLFGDTVNTASRMESSGETMKIQITESTKVMLEKYSTQFDTEERGQIPIKGKGMLTTYWLEEGLDFKETA